MSKHPIVHIEFSAENLASASQFYKDLFGWKITQMPEMNYAMFESQEDFGGGLNPVQENNPAGTVMVYVGTEDIEATLVKAESLGAMTIVPKSEIPDMGWFAMFRDPTGNVIGLYKALNQ